MKKWGMLLLSFLLFTGCSAKEEETISILVPKGAPSLAFIELFQNAEIDWKTVDGTDIISAEMIKENPAYDIIVAPINLGVKLMDSNADFKLHSVLTWGNLYLVAEDGYENNPQLVAFGENAVPQKILEDYLSTQTLLNDPTYVNSASDAQAMLLSSQANVALLAQPVAAATIAKGTEVGKNLKIIANLQQSYSNKYESGEQGYPQAAIFVKNGSESKVATVLQEVESFVSLDSTTETEERTSYIEAIGVEELGIPNATIALKTWDAQNIRLRSAESVMKEINLFLAKFALSIDETKIVK